MSGAACTQAYRGTEPAEVLPDAGELDWGGWVQDVDVERVWSGLLATCSSAPAQNVAADCNDRAAKMDEDIAGGLLIAAGHSAALGSKLSADCAAVCVCFGR